MKRMQREQGFSLLETLIALTLFAAGVMAVMKLFPMSLRQAQGAAERTVAAQLADSKFGTLRTEGYARVAPNAGRYMQDAASDLSIPPALRFTISSIEQVGDIYGIYDGYSTKIQRMGASDGAGLHRVVFNVKMYDGRYERFVTYLANP